MSQLQITSPLKWPGHATTTDRLLRQINPQFQLNMKESEALSFIEDEIARTPEIISAVLSCDAVNLNSTMPTQYLSKNPGAALRINLENSRHHLCCDRWQSLAHNIYALHLGIRYFRQLADWGLGSLSVLMGGLCEKENIINGSASDFSSLTEWQIVLGLGPSATLDDANALYRIRAKSIGESDPAKLQQLNLAIQQAREVLAG